MKILLSIKPEFSNKIFDGDKLFEFRKQVPKKRFDKVLVYESSPTQHIVGWFRVGRIIKGHPDDVWQTCKQDGGIDKNRYYQYCKGNQQIYAFEIMETHRFASPINPFKLVDNFTPPQNFAYLETSSCLLNNVR